MTGILFASLSSAKDTILDVNLVLSSFEHFLFFVLYFSCVIAICLDNFRRTVVFVVVNQSHLKTYLFVLLFIFKKRIPGSNVPLQPQGVFQWL